MFVSTWFVHHSVLSYTVLAWFGYIGVSVVRLVIAFSDHMYECVDLVHIRDYSCILIQFS